MPGKIVKIQGKSEFGRTKDEDLSINGKIKVYFEDGTKIIIRPEKLTPVGWWD